MKTTSAENGQNIFYGNPVNNLLSYCGLIDAKIRAFDKDLTVSLTKLFEFIYLLSTYVHYIKMFKSKQV